MLKKILLTFIILMLVYSLKAQLDSIEYNYWKPIYDFEIINNQYCFKNWGDRKIVETDSLLFKADKFFNNYPFNKYNPEEIDFVQFAIASRTLKNFIMRKYYITKISLLSEYAG